MNMRAYLDAVPDNSPLRRTTGRAVGMVGTNIPVELVLAADAIPVQLGSYVDDAGDLALADPYLESSFSLESRIVASQWLSGALDSLDAVIFSRSDDSAQRLYYYICELQRMNECGGPRPLIYDVARITRAASQSHTLESTQLLANALGTQHARLPAAAQRVSERADLLMELAKLRTSDAVPLGSLAHRIIRSARVDWSEEFERQLRPWLLAPETVIPDRRILLVGSAPSDERPHVAVESSGGVIVAEINETPNLVASAPSFDSIALRVYEQTHAARSALQSPTELVKFVHEMRADGVIVWMLATDTGLAWEAPRIERAMIDANLPHLMLTSQPDTWDESALAQAQQFVRKVTPQ